MAKAKTPSAKPAGKPVAEDPGRTPAPVANPTVAPSPAPELDCIQSGPVPIEVEHVLDRPEQEAPTAPLLEGAIPKLHYDEIDVAFCLARSTQDGKGEREPSPSNFTGYITEGVEKED